jgi:hypothetical protein
MKQDSATIAKILNLSSHLDKLAGAGRLFLEYPTSEDHDSELDDMQENPMAVDYIVRTEQI